MEFVFIFVFIILFISIILGKYLYKVNVIIPYKNNIVKKGLLECDPNIKYIYENKVSHFKPISQAYDLISRANKYQETDMIIDGNIISVDLEAYHIVSNGKTSSKVIDFKGRMYDVYLENKYNCDFILKEEILNRAPTGFKLLDVEVIAFNKKFNLYVSNQEEAFHHFTPHVIKKLVELEQIASGKLILAYINNHLVFGENDKGDWFEGLNSTLEVHDEYIKQKEKILKFVELFQNGTI